MIEILFTMAPIEGGWRLVPLNSDLARVYAEGEVSEPEWLCLDELWQRESSWQTRRTAYKAVNRSSGAYGIPQALPAEKMSTAGKDWRYNPITQVKWGLSYIDDRYGTPCKALDHHNKKGWY
jgi:hypothetical protein